MPETPAFKLPYPTLDDVAVAADDVAALALAIDGQLPGGPTSLIWPVVTTLPTAPTDGYVCILTDSSRSFVWLVRYDAAMTGTYKWLVLYASPLLGRYTTQGGFSGTSYSPLSGGPSVTIPRRGVYEVEVGAELGNTARMAPAGLGQQVSDDNSAGILAVAGDVQSCKGESVLTITQLGSLTSYYRVQQPTTTGTASRRWIKATPVLIS